MLIVHQELGGTGWSPVAHMARLAARCFGAEVVALQTGGQLTRGEKLRAALWSRRTGTETCLVIAGYPWTSTSFLRIQDWRQRFGRVVVWVIDSFWSDRVPRLARHVRLFDHVFVTTEEDVPAWSRLTRAPTSHLPWGADVLRLGSASPDRSFDLLRVGREPPEWDDDRLTREDCERAGLRFAGRPPVPARAEEVQPALMSVYAQSRYVLAFSNAVNPTRYTHPSRDYLTGRWVDALACGAVVAGVAPTCRDARRLLWPGATLDLGGVRRREGLRVIADAVRSWSPAQARTNHRYALERLDWRWRFQEIADVLGESPPALRADVEALRRRIDDLDADGGTATAAGQRP